MLKENAVCCLSSQMNLDLLDHGQVAFPQPLSVRLLVCCSSLEAPAAWRPQQPAFSSAPDSGAAGAGSRAEALFLLLNNRERPLWGLATASAQVFMSCES